MKRILIVILALFSLITVEAKNSYYRFIEMNRNREFAGVETVVEGEAKKIECFSFKYDKQKRPVEIKHLSKMTECAGDFAGLGENISLMKIEYKDTVETFYDSLLNAEERYAVKNAIYKTFNERGEQVPFRGEVYKMVHTTRKKIVEGKEDKTNYFIVWENYGKNDSLCADILGVSIYRLEYMNEGGLDLVVSSRFDQNLVPIKDRNGVERVDFQYDELGRLLFQTFKEKSGSRINGNDGYCEIGISRADSDGMFHEIKSYYDKEGNQCLNNFKSFKIKYSYDENRYLTEFLHLDTLGKPMAAGDKTTYGRFIRDNFFYILRAEYFTSVKDALKKTPPQLKIDGASLFFTEGYEYKYDSKGLLIEKAAIKK